MPFLFKDYTDCVLKDYEEKRNANLLSRLLMQPTAANIKQDCLNVYNYRINKGEKEEENTLRAFFGVPPVGRNFGYIIERINPDRFRPLQSFIKREIKNPALVTVELLAWLIDFTPRPLAYAQKILGNPHDSSAASQLTDINLPREPKGPLAIEPGKITVERNGNPNDASPQNPGKKIQNKYFKIAVAIGLVMAVIFGGMYIRRQQSPGEIPYGVTNINCMYWANDHYEPAPCKEKGKGLLFPLDEEKMKSFRKITRKDTITEWSVGKIYYIQNSKEIECYTEGGDYPKDPSRKLRLLSQYMFDKHLRKKEPPAKDSLAAQNAKSITNR